MSYTLILGNKNYSSWSMRAWLLMKFADLPFEEKVVDLYTGNSRQEVMALGGETGLVPVLVHEDLRIWDTLAITEYLYESRSVIWPKHRALRARARSLCGEVHSGLSALREAMPVNTRARNRSVTITRAVDADIRRVKQLWESCMLDHGGVWLFGEFSAADIFFAPVATRFQTYAVQVEGTAASYQNRILSHTLVKEWMAAGESDPSTIEEFESA